MRTLLYFPLCLAIWLLSGCSSDTDNNNKPRSAEDHVWETQVHALEKAKGVEQTLMDAAARQRKTIDQESQ
ncbi:MAG: hypothetical protein V3W33_01750 [Gammaproteobacteria bacterium]|jgi:outer membrane biogenesis lipoprotein LolB